MVIMPHWNIPDKSHITLAVNFWLFVHFVHLDAKYSQCNIIALFYRLLCAIWFCCKYHTGWDISTIWFYCEYHTGWDISAIWSYCKYHVGWGITLVILTLLLCLKLCHTFCNQLQAFSSCFISFSNGSNHGAVERLEMDYKVSIQSTDLDSTELVLPNKHPKFVLSELDLKHYKKWSILWLMFH